MYNSLHLTSKQMIPVKISQSGKISEIMIQKGQSLLKQLTKNNIQINDACEGNLGCGTCHIILDDDSFKKIKISSEKEEDLLQFVPNLKPTSRLACGILIDDSLANAVIQIPKLNRNLLSEHD